MVKINISEKDEYRTILKAKNELRELSCTLKTCLRSSPTVIDDFDLRLYYHNLRMIVEESDKLSTILQTMIELYTI